jgi:hypothetical protein
VSPDDTLPCSSIPPTADEREERAKVAYAVYRDKFPVVLDIWEILLPDEQEAWRCAADAAYRHVIISPT